MQGQSYKNPFDIKVKDKEDFILDSKTLEKAREMYDDKPYMVRMRKAMLGSWLLRFACNVISIMTLMAVVAFVFYAPMGKIVGGDAAAYVTCIGSMGLAFMTELMKNALSELVFVYYFKYKTIAKMAAIALIVIIATSTAGSYFGGAAIPAATTKVASFDGSEFEEREEELQEQIAEVRKTTSWKGKATKATNQQIAAIQTQQAALLAEKQAAQAAFSSDRQEQKEQIMHYEYIFGAIALINEGILILCSIFIAYYYYRVTLETEDDLLIDSSGADSPTVATTTAPPPPPTMPTTTPSTGQPAPPSNRKPIGFFVSDEVQTVIIKPEPPADNKNPHLRECEHCQKQFQYNHKKQIFCGSECRYAANKARKAAAE
jgi:hypothetical protein